MEFETLQKIWDTQSNQPLYAINEKALDNYIASKKNQANHIARFSEWLLIIVNLATGGFILGTNFITQERFFLYLLAAWMFGSALYVLVGRLRRISGQNRFDRSMLGDLQHAISIASYQVRLSHIMRWNILPIGILILLSFWESGKQFWLAMGSTLFFMLTFYASGWEHNIYKAKKRGLETLQQKLQQEETGIDNSPFEK